MTADNDKGGGRHGWSRKALGKVRRIDVMFPLDERDTLEQLCLHYGKTASGLIRWLVEEHAAWLHRKQPNWRRDTAREDSETG